MNHVELEARIFHAMVTFCLGMLVLLVVFAATNYFVQRAEINERKRKSRQTNLDKAWGYKKTSEFIKRNEINVPCMIIDETMLNQNIDYVISEVAGSQKTVRVATKSIRCVGVMKHIEKRAKEVG